MSFGLHFSTFRKNQAFYKAGKKRVSGIVDVLWTCRCPAVASPADFAADAVPSERPESWLVDKNLVSDRRVLKQKRIREHKEMEDESVGCRNYFLTGTNDLPAHRIATKGRRRGHTFLSPRVERTMRQGGVSFLCASTATYPLPSFQVNWLKRWGCCLYRCPREQCLPKNHAEKFLPSCYLRRRDDFPSQETFG